jgi:uncharacterized protein (DUF2235 family)
VHCLGLWDSVSSVGWLWDPPSYPYTATNPSVDVVWHAISIDERRWSFRQNRMYQARTDQHLHEEWFPGVHSDVGGGYPEADGGLWRAPFAWILDGTQASGLLVDPGRLAAVLTRTPPPVAPCEEPKHESLTAASWLAREVGEPAASPPLRNSSGIADAGQAGARSTGAPHNGPSCGSLPRNGVVRAAIW